MVEIDIHRALEIPFNIFHNIKQKQFWSDFSVGSIQSNREVRTFPNVIINPRNEAKCSSISVKRLFCSQLVTLLFVLSPFIKEEKKEEVLNEVTVKQVFY